MGSEPKEKKSKKARKAAAAGERPERSGATEGPGGQSPGSAEKTAPAGSDPWKFAFVALLVVALVCVVTWVLLGSRLLVVREVSVEGLERVPEHEAASALGVETGTPLIKVDLEAAAERVDALDLVEEAEVVRSWPATLRVEVAEREPVLAVQVGEGYRLVDGDGVRIEDSDTRPGAQPLVSATGEIEGNAGVRAAADIVESAPDSLLAQMQLIDASEGGRIIVHLADGSTVEWGDASDTQGKSDVLRVLMGEHPPQEDQVYDVSNPDLAIVR